MGRRTAPAERSPSTCRTRSRPPAPPCAPPARAG
uniref:Uncharacterized protein n=1 Tax=Arundo donax TaxID=35708 RepID=A0A0A8ZEH3_ARUDO